MRASPAPREQFSFGLLATAQVLAGCHGGNCLGIFQVAALPWSVWRQMTIMTGLAALAGTSSER
jgi:hypothetical protein